MGSAGEAAGGEGEGDSEIRAGLGYHQPASPLSSVGIMAAATGATASVIYVPAPFCQDSILEAVDAGIEFRDEVQAETEEIREWLATVSWLIANSITASEGDEPPDYQAAINHLDKYLPYL